MKSGFAFVLGTVSLTMMVCTACSSTRTADPFFEKGVYGSLALYLEARHEFPESREWDEFKVLEEYTFTNLLLSARTGNPTAQKQLSTLYAFGIGVAKDIERSEYWLENAAKNGSPSAQYDLAIRLHSKTESGIIDGSVSFPAIRRWLERSAANGYGPAYVALANYYMFWPVPDHSRRKGIRLLEKATELGEPVEWYLKAAKAGELFKNQKWNDSWD